MRSIAHLVNQAKALLQKHQYDIAHDLSHHERVWKLAQQILKHENLPVDKDALKMACFWHDVVLEPKDEQENRQIHINETLEYLRQRMQEEKFRPEFQTTVLDAIRDHGFEKKWQLNLEGEVLFDADKLDALSPERYTKVVAAIKHKQLSKIKVFMYTQAAKLWLRTMRKRYHFETSRKLHDQKIEQLLADTETIQLAKELGIDIRKLLK